MSVDLANFDLREGDLLAGKFRVERLLGSGGMGVVVEATHITLKDRVALKFLRSPKFADQTTITRFLREAQAAARIKSPHVARVIDVGTLDDGSPYMVMEFLEGMDLGTLLDREGVLPVEQAVTYALQTCEALAAAHASGVIHRDIKPSNLFLTRGPDQTPLVKVLDFGISKIFDGTSSGSITETQRAVGSPSYMAPEQMRSAKRVDGRADIWSMGVVLYELLAGRAPFVADTIPELYALILDKVSRPTPLRTLRAELPEGLEVIAERCLEKNADQRYVDIAELAAALAPFGGEFGPVSAARSRRILESAGLAGNVAGRSDPPDRPASARATGLSDSRRKAAQLAGLTPRPRRRSRFSGPRRAHGDVVRRNAGASAPAAKNALRFRRSGGYRARRRGGPVGAKSIRSAEHDRARSARRSRRTDERSGPAERRAPPHNGRTRRSLGDRAVELGSRRIVVRRLAVCVGASFCAGDKQRDAIPTRASQRKTAERRRLVAPKMR